MAGTRTKRRKDEMRGKSRYLTPALKILSAVILLFTVSCNYHDNYSFNEEMPLEGWSRFNTPLFTPQISDTISSFDILVSIRNNRNYPYRNLFLFITTISPEGYSLRDTVEYQLADERGNWYGKGPGDIHNLSVPFRSNIKFPVPGEYSFKIEQGMRVDNLPGILDIGLLIKKINN